MSYFNYQSKKIYYKETGSGKPIVFCQYYACKDSDESWEGYTAMAVPTALTT